MGWKVKKILILLREGWIRWSMISMDGCSPRKLHNATPLIKRNTNSWKVANIIKHLQKGRVEKSSISQLRYLESSMVVTLLKYLLKRWKRQVKMAKSTMQLCPSVVNTNSSRIVTNRQVRPSTVCEKGQISHHFVRKSPLFSTGQRKFTVLVLKDQRKRRKCNRLMSFVPLETRTRR